MKAYNIETAKRYYRDYRKSEYASFDDFLFDIIYTFPEAYNQIIDDKDSSPLPTQVWNFINFCEENFGKSHENF